MSEQMKKIEEKKMWQAPEIAELDVSNTNGFQNPEDADPFSERAS